MQMKMHACAQTYFTYCAADTGFHTKGIFARETVESSGNHSKEECCIAQSDAQLLKNEILPTPISGKI